MKVLIVSPGFIPSATVGKIRMVSLSKYLMQFDKVTVIQNKISSYPQITDEKPVKGVKVIEADVGETFSSGVKAYKRALSKVDLAKHNAGIEPKRKMASDIKSKEGIEKNQVHKIDKKN